MNAQNSSPTPPPAPVKKEKILKDDGRFLYYYAFPGEQGNAQAPAAAEKTEDAHV